MDWSDLIKRYKTIQHERILLIRYFRLDSGSKWPWPDLTPRGPHISIIPSRLSIPVFLFIVKHLVLDIDVHIHTKDSGLHDWTTLSSNFNTQNGTETRLDLRPRPTTVVPPFVSFFCNLYNHISSLLRRYLLYPHLPT